MHERALHSWDELPSAIDQIIRELSKYSVPRLKQQNRILYRGQADSGWHLKSTLERFSASLWSLDSYARLALRCAPQIESFTHHNWSLPHYTEVENEIKKESDEFRIHIPCYEFWAYLRHQGFPSPLLDWTASRDVAAFFAFAEHNSAENASVFVYLELPTGMKFGWSGAPQISVQGPNVGTHERHFLQQSWYTVCTKYEGDSHTFVCHEEVFDRSDPDQDVLIKITMPRSERLKVLSRLNEIDINYFSLFQTEEALMKTLAFNEIEMKNP